MVTDNQTVVCLCDETVLSNRETGYRCAWVGLRCIVLGEKSDSTACCVKPFV